MFTSRAYAGAADLQLILRFVRSVRPPALLLEYPGLADLPRLLAEYQATARLWLGPQDRLAGFAYVDAFQSLRFDLDWQHPLLSALATAVIAWGTACVRQRPSALSQPGVLISTSHTADSARIALLEQHGFTPCDQHIVHMRVALAAPVPPPLLPPGFVLRQVRGVEEAPALAALHRAAFGTPHMTTERRLHMLQAPDYDSTLDLVVQAPDGGYAAYARGSVSAEENALSGRNECYADLFATHPSYRCLRLAQALMRTLLGRLKERGFEAARLSTGSENLAMQQVAHGAGFRITASTLRYQKHSSGAVAP